VGNLDEAFTISRSINPDIDADEYRRFTEKINVADIKTALQRRFRNEQIARLGNNHLIYKSFSHKDFQNFIKLLLKSISSSVKKNFDIKLTFTPQTEQILYKESVFPTQGVRPVMSTIRNLIEGNFMKVLFKIRESDSHFDQVTWDFDGDAFRISLTNHDHKLKEEMNLNFVQKVNDLRKSTKNNLQALVAVHEAGHTIAAMMIIGIVPEYVVSRTVDS
jgi:cell division protease FtsH